jgi:hypothetical protein
MDPINDMTPFRDATAALERYAGELAEARRRALAELPPELSRIHAARTARTALGVCWTVAGLILLGQGVGRSGDAPPDGVAHQIIVAGLVYGAIAYALAWIAARVAWRARVAPQVAPTLDVHRRIDLLRAAAPAGEARRLLSRGELASIAFPLVGLSLLLPLTVHLGWVAVTGNDPFAMDFDEWVAFSAKWVGHCHLICAALAWRYARRVTASPARPASALGLYGWVVLSSLFPGIVLLGYPVLIVAVTGLVLLPAFPYLAHRIRVEREVIEG